MIFPLEIIGSGERFVSYIASDKEQYYLNFAIYCACWCHFYTMKQQLYKKINSLIIK